MAPGASEPAMPNAWQDARFSPVKLAAAADTLEETGVAPDPLLPLQSLTAGNAQIWVFPKQAGLKLPGMNARLHRFLIEMQMAPHLANAITAAQTSRECARLFEALAGETSVSRRVYDELMRTPGKFPDIESVATRLRLTNRTLRRHLRREEQSFSALLAFVRRALAEDYPSSTRMSIEDIAGALAFDNGRSFRQAFGRWTGKSPAEFKRALPTFEGTS